MAFARGPWLIFKWFDNNNDPASGWKVNTYIAGSVVPTDTYSDDIGTVNSNPVVLDARGEAEVWLSDAVVYKFVITDGDDVVQATFDNITGVGGVISGGGSGAGGTIGQIQYNIDGTNLGGFGSVDGSEVDMGSRLVRATSFVSTNGNRVATLGADATNATLSLTDGLNTVTINEDGAFGSTADYVFSRGGVEKLRVGSSALTSASVVKSDNGYDTVSSDLLLKRAGVTKLTLGASEATFVDGVRATQFVSTGAFGTTPYFALYGTSLTLNADANSDALLTSSVGTAQLSNSAGGHLAQVTANSTSGQMFVRNDADTNINGVLTASATQAFSRVSHNSFSVTHTADSASAKTTLANATSLVEIDSTGSINSNTNDLLLQRAGVTKLTLGASEATFDNSLSVFLKDVEASGQINLNVGTYGFRFQVTGSTIPTITPYYNNNMLLSSAIVYDGINDLWEVKTDLKSDSIQTSNYSSTTDLIFSRNGTTKLTIGTSSITSTVVLKSDNGYDTASDTDLLLKRNAVTKLTLGTNNLTTSVDMLSRAMRVTGALNTAGLTSNGLELSWADVGGGTFASLIKSYDRTTLSAEPIVYDASQHVFITGAVDIQAALTANSLTVDAGNITIDRSTSAFLGTVVDRGATPLARFGILANNYTYITNNATNDGVNWSRDDGTKWGGVIRLGTALAADGQDLFNISRVNSSNVREDLFDVNTGGEVFKHQSSTTETINGNIYNQYTTVTRAGAVTQQSLAGTGAGSRTIGAGRLNTQGAGIEIFLCGTYTTDALAGSATIRIRFGSTTFRTIGSFTLDNNVTNGIWWIRGQITTRTTGATGTIGGQLMWEHQASSVAGSEVLHVVPSTSTADVTLDLTASQTFDVDWTATDAGTSISCSCFSISAIR